jgi:hypothetical protein
MYDAALMFSETGEGDYRLGLFAYSATDDCDLLDIEETAQANPSLNLEHGPDWDNLAGKARRAKIAGGEVEAKYRTEVLCQRVRSLEPMPVTVEMWQAQTDEESRIVADAPVVLTAEIALDRRSASIGVAGFREDGATHVELINNGGDGYGMDWLLPRLLGLVEKHQLYEIERRGKKCVAIVLDPSSPAGDLVDELRREDIEPVLMTAREVATACGTLQDALIERTVWHPDQAAIDDALIGAVRRDLGDGGWAFGRRKSSVDITPLVAVTNARWGLSIVEPELDPEIDGFY